MARKMKDSGVEWIGEIPENCKIRKLKNVSEISSGEYVSKEDYESQGIFDIIGSNGKIGTINKTNINRKVITTGRVGSIGTAYIVQNVWVTDNALIIENKNNILVNYLAYIIPMFPYEIISTGTAQPLITATILKNQFIPYFNLKEQQKIVAFLDEKVEEIDSVIAKTKETIEDYKKYKQAIISDAVTKGLNPNVEMKESKNSYLGMIPEHWIEKRLRFLGMCQNGISKSLEYFGEGYPFVSYGDVYKNYVLPDRVSGLIKSSEEDRSIYSVQYGDVFFTRTSETIEEIGFASTCLKTIDNATFAGFVIRFRPNNQEELLPEFSKYYFRSDVHRKFFVKEMNLVTRASLSQELLKKLPVLLPPLEEQKEIAKYLDGKCSEIDKLIAKKEELFVDLESYKKSLIYEYVTGKKEVD